MNMRNIYIYMLLAVTTLTLSSCDDFLDKLPDNRMDLNSKEKVQKYLVSAYPDHNPAYLTELYSDNADEFDVTGWGTDGIFQDQAFAWKDITETQDKESPQELWNSLYMAMGTANTALQTIEQSGNSTSSDYQASKGEALLCRAYAAFMLSNTFCMAYDATTADKHLGLPYPLQPETIVGAKYERGTLAAFYKQINSDIEAGLPLVTDNYSRPKYHFTRNAAYAFAALFNLYYQKYDKAVAYASHVLGTNASSKLRDWKAFNSLSANGQIAPNAYVNASSQANLLLQTVYSQAGAYLGPYGVGNKYAHGQLISEKEDLQSRGPWGRSADFGYTVWSNNSLSKFFINKVPYSFEYTDVQAGIGHAHSAYAVLTTDLTLLVRAEAYAMLGKYNEAVADLNTEVKAYSSGALSVTLDGIKDFYNGISYYTPTDPTPKKRFNTAFNIEPTTQEPLLHAILQLRRIMTTGEGWRLQDVKRYGMVIYRRTLSASSAVVAVKDSLTANDPRRAIQLPQDVITAGLPANPRNK